MRTALVGHTGFVGSNLKTQTTFTDLYNSSNIGEIAGKSYDLVVCAGARAEKWKINQDPETDWQNLSELMGYLGQASIKELVLISTIDVYPNPQGVDEETVIDPSENTPYGAHRYRFEEFCRSHFSTTIVRLPGLFGTGLKKNIIFDFLNNNNVERIHADAVFQFYNLAHLWADISVAREKNVSLLNIATEPVSVREVAEQAFGMAFDNQPEGMSPASYDMRTSQAARFGKPGNYLYDKTTVLAELRSFVEESRK